MPSQARVVRNQLALRSAGAGRGREGATSFLVVGQRAAMPPLPRALAGQSAGHLAAARPNCAESANGGLAPHAATQAKRGHLLPRPSPVVAPARRALTLAALPPLPYQTGSPRREKPGGVCRVLLRPAV